MISLMLSAFSDHSAVFALLAAPRSNSKSVILHGAVCKNFDETISVADFGNHFPSKVAESDGRVVKY